MLGLGLGLAGGARGWVAGRAGFWDVLATWVWGGSSSPWVPGHPTSMCDSGVNFTIEKGLTNRMRFSVVCTLIDNDTRHHSGQNVVDSRGVENVFFFRARAEKGIA